MADNYNHYDYPGNNQYRSNLAGTGYVYNHSQYTTIPLPVESSSNNSKEISCQNVNTVNYDISQRQSSSYCFPLDCQNSIRNNDFNLYGSGNMHIPTNANNCYQLSEPPTNSRLDDANAVNDCSVLKHQPQSFYKAAASNLSLNNIQNIQQKSSDVQHLSFNSQRNCSSTNGGHDNYDEKVLEFINRVKSQTVKPKSYEDRVSEFIEKNSRFRKKNLAESISEKGNKLRNIERGLSSNSNSNKVINSQPNNFKHSKSIGNSSLENVLPITPESMSSKEIKKSNHGSINSDEILAKSSQENLCWDKPNVNHIDTNSCSFTNGKGSGKFFSVITPTDATRITNQANKDLHSSCKYKTHYAANDRAISEIGIMNESHPRNTVQTSIENTFHTDNGIVNNHDNIPIKEALSHSPSPEKKYMHLVRVAEKSPERKFLERLNSRAHTPESHKCHSRSSSISPTCPSKDCSESSRQYRMSSSSSQSFRYSRSSSRSSSSKRSDIGNYSSRHSSLSRTKRSDSLVNNTRSLSSSRGSVKKDFPTTSKESDKQCTDHELLKSTRPVTFSQRLGERNDFSKDRDKLCTEREALLQKYTKDYCSDMNEMQNKMDELSKLNVDDIIKRETQIWTRMSPANLYYQPSGVANVLKETPKLNNLCTEFENVLVKRADNVRAKQPKYTPSLKKKRIKFSKHKSEISSCSSSGSESEISTDEEDCTMEELERKRKHPFRLHPELWFNDVGEMNDGPLCRCSAKARRSGIRHNIYAGESNLPKCDETSNNANTLYHYRITISPPTNFLIKTPTIISHDDHEFIFEGFSMFSHTRLDKLPVCKVIRFNIEYTILYFEEKMLENFTIKELDLFYEYLFKELLELVDLDLKAAGDKLRCAQFHFMPRFVRELPENGKEILSMNEVLSYLLRNSDDLVDNDKLENIQRMPQYEWQKQVDLIKGMVVTRPGMKPCAVRVDQLDRDEVQGKSSVYPEIVHFGIRPPQLSYAGNPEYQKAWREYVKFRHLLANMPKPSFDDKRKLEIKETKLQEMRTQSKMKRDVTVTVDSQGFKKTGIMCDIVQHAMLIPVLVSHLRFHCSLAVLEETIGYSFNNRYLLQLALTHPSYRENFGTNPDHARNSLTNCGIRQPEYGDRRIHYMNTRKRGINTLINIMSRFGKRTETESNITHNERLEFLGDAVVEFITSIHLFHMFPELEEGGLATYRAAIVQNQHLAVLAKTMKLDEFMLYAHGSDLCHDLELRHAMANCFEALMGALFLDGGIEVADKVFGETLFKTEPDLLEVWVNYPPHPLQEQEPLGDRKWIPRFELLKKLTEFEHSIGIEFTHIRLLARAFTDRSIGYTNLTLGSNQRLEFLGDTVLQLIASEYLYKYFPEHHEGHLSLLRSSLVNNRTQAVVCNDLGMTKYALYHNPKAELKTKDRADLLEAFLGALYVDKGLEYCETFCNVCFFPRLQMFIMRQDWNDPKSKLQQCCLTLRTMEGGEPEIPIYKVIECMGPTNTRIYTVAVYFKGQRLAEASGHSIQQAEMNAAKKALQRSQGLFPQLDHQKRVIAKSLKSQHTLRSESNTHSLRTGKIHNTNKQFIKRCRKDTGHLLKRSKRDSPSNDRNIKRVHRSAS